MISRTGSKGFFAAHYDWVALGVGVVALGVGACFYLSGLGEDPDEAAAAEVAKIDRMKPSETGVAPVDMSGYESASSAIRKPVLLAEVPEKSESFLASERRVLCKCKKVISGDVRLVPACPYCGEKQQEEQKVVLDADGDGMPDEWEKRYGLNPNDPSDAATDADGDEFSNLEEYTAKTDPTDKKDHPDYLDSLTIVLPLKETYLPFIFTKATKIPSGWRCEFFDAKQKDDYGRLGRTITAVLGEEIGTSGFTLKGYEKKESKRAIKGSANMKTVDVSEATVVRKTDGKVLKLVIVESKRAKPMAVDVQATLSYARGTVRTFDVVTGSELVLSGVRYRVSGIQAVGKGAKVTVENPVTGRKRTLEALD